jgi:hypothetical protein
LKKFTLIAALTLFAAPYVTSARGDRDDDFGRRHRHMNASEFAGAGFAAAALIGIAGYLALRRRGARQN